MLPTGKNPGTARHFSTTKTCVICDFGLKPSFGLGIDFSPAMIEQARRLHPDLQFEVGDVEDPPRCQELSTLSLSSIPSARSTTARPCLRLCMESFQSMGQAAIITGRDDSYHLCLR